MDLQSVSALMKEEIGDTMALLVAGHPVSALSRQVNNLSRQFQSLGICYLLTEGDRYKYQENLARSAHSRIFLNQSLNQNGNGDDRHLGISRSDSLFDALTAGQLKLALDIVDSSYRSWHKAWEYEDDHLYHKIMHELVRWLAGHPLPPLQADLDRWGEALAGGSTTRLDLCKAIITKDADAFLDALDIFISERKAWFDEKALSIASAQADFWPRKFISTEAMAFINLAQWLNIAPEDEFEMCPTSGLCPFQDRIFDNFFDEIRALI